MDLLQFVASILLVFSFWATCSRVLPTGIFGTLGFGFIMLACLAVLNNDVRSFRHAIALFMAGDILIAFWIVGRVQRARDVLKRASPSTDFGAMYGTTSRTPSTRC